MVNLPRGNTPQKLLVKEMIMDLVDIIWNYSGDEGFIVIFCH